MKSGVSLQVRGDGYRLPTGGDGGPSAAGIKALRVVPGRCRAGFQPQTRRQTPAGLPRNVVELWSGALTPSFRARGGGQHKQTNDPRNNQHSPSTPTTGLRERGNDTSKSTGRSGRQKAATRRNMRREERVTVQGPVKEQQRDGRSHRGAGETEMPEKTERASSVSECMSDCVRGEMMDRVGE